MFKGGHYDIVQQGKIFLLRKRIGVLVLIAESEIGANKKK
jgi:hypothetical protein